MESPEIVKKHLSTITKSSSESEFLIHRIFDSETYPSLETPELRARSSLLIRRLMSQNPLIDSKQVEFEDGNEIQTLVSLIKPYMEATGITFEDLSRLIEDRAKTYLINKPITLFQDI